MLNKVEMMLIGDLESRIMGPSYIYITILCSASSTLLLEGLRITLLNVTADILINTLMHHIPSS